MFGEKKIEEEIKVEAEKVEVKEEPKEEVKEEPKVEVKEEPKPEPKLEEPKLEEPKEEPKPKQKRSRRKKNQETKKEEPNKEESAVSKAKESKPGKDTPKELKEVEEVPEIIGSHERASRVWNKIKNEPPKPRTRYVVTDRIILYGIPAMPGAIFEVVSEPRSIERQPKGVEKPIHFVKVRGVGPSAFSLRKISNVFSPL